MLTSEERDVAVERMKVYPQGVPSSAWGFGPFAHTGVAIFNLSDEAIREYG